MSQLDLLWKLEEQNNLLKKKKMNQDLKNQKLKIESIENRINDLMKEIEIYKEKISDYVLKIKKKEIKLKSLRYEVEKIDEELYSGNISDLNQLEHLNKEKEDVFLKINNIELEVLTMMEEEENINLNIKELSSKLANKKEKLSITKKDYKNQSKLINKKILEEEKVIINLNNQIQDNILEKYNNIKGKKESAIVKVSNDICSGCNMRIPTYLLSALKSNKELIYCENCGRILYINLNLEEE